MSLLALLALALPATATPTRTVTTTSVRLVSVTSPINHGAYATLTAAVSRSATCAITVYCKSGPSSAAGVHGIDHGGPRWSCRLV